MQKEALDKALESLRLDDIAHVHGASLRAHLGRVRDRMERWGFSEEVCSAAQCHSLYGTPYFENAALPLSRRSWLQDLIGQEAEELVYHFSRMNRRLFRDSLKEFLDQKIASPQLYVSGEMRPSSLTFEQARALLHIWVANDLDHDTPHTTKNIEHAGKFVAFTSILCEEAQKDLTPSMRPASASEVLVIAGGAYHPVVAELLARGYRVTICSPPMFQDFFRKAVRRLAPRDLKAALLDRSWHAVLDFSLTNHSFVPMSPLGALPNIRRYILISLLREAKELQTPGILSNPLFSSRILDTEEVWSREMGERLWCVRLADLVDNDDHGFFLGHVLSWILSNPSLENRQIAPLILKKEAVRQVVDFIESPQRPSASIDLRADEDVTIADLQRWMSPDFLKASGIAQAVSRNARRI